MLASSRLRRTSMLVVTFTVVTASARAADYTVTNQAEFNAAVAAATQPGQNDTIHVNAANISSLPALMLPGAATALTINFNGVSGGPTVYNPTFDVGLGTIGQLGIGPGTTLNFNTDNGIASWRVGFADGGAAGNGTVDMTGGTVRAAGTSNYFSLNVGRGSPDSSGIFNQSGGIIEIGGGAFNLGVVGGTGTYTMTGNAEVNFTPGATIAIGGSNSGIGTLFIHDNAQFLANGAGGDIYIGDAGGTGVIVQDGTGSRVVLGSDTRLGGGRGGTTQGGTGTYNISAGTLEIGEQLRMGFASTSTGILNQTGGTVLLNGPINFGAGTGIYNLNGGTLQVNNANPFNAGSGSYAFNLGGGTIQALTNFTAGINFSLTSGMSTIDTNSWDATFNGAMSGAGGLIKAGNGNLTLNAANMYTGGTLISGGTLTLGAGASLPSTGALQVNSGATFDMVNQLQQVGSLGGAGDVVVGTGFLAAGGNGMNTAFSGTIDGAFAKIGPGTMLIDNATFGGETYIAGGAFAQTSGNTLVNYLAVGEQPGNSGSLNMTGGTITIGTALQVGDFGGVGTVNQTGGIMQLLPLCGNPASCTALNLGNQGGTGTYNISGGELRLTGWINTIGRNTGANPGSTGTLNIMGGVVDLSNNGTDPSRLIIGFGNSDASQQQSQGTINQTGGVLRVHDGSTLNIGGQNTSRGVYNLFGGTLEIGADSLVAGYNNPNPNYAFNLGGGTIRVIESDLTTSVDATLVSGISTIDTNGLGAIWSGVLSGSGGLVKAGAGTLILDAANTYTGGTQITGGTLMLGAGGSLASTGALQVDAAGTFDLNSHVQTVGAFSGAGNVLLGTGQLTTESASNTLFSGVISGSGSFVKEGGGRLVLSGANTYTGDTAINAGTLVVNGSLVSVVNVNGGTLGGEGTIGGLNVASGATLAPGNSIGTMRVAGNATFAPSSIYQVEFGGTQSDMTVVDGTVMIDGGTVVLQQVGPLSLATPYTILTAAGGRTGTFEGVTGTDLVFLDPVLGYSATDVFLSFVRSETDFVDVARTRNQRAVAGALDRFAVSDPLASILLSGTAENAHAALDPLSGEVHASTAGMLVLDSFYVRDAIFGRLIQASYSGPGAQTVALGANGQTTVAMIDPSSRMSLGAGVNDFDGALASPPSFGHGLASWTRGFGAWGDLDSNGNAATADRSLGGVVSGIDAGLGGGWRAGLATGYIQSNIGVDARSSSADIDSYVLAAYAGGPAGPFAIRSGGAWTWHSLDTSRNVVFPGFFESERASYDADTGQLFAEIAYPVLYGSSAWEPFAGLAYVHVDTDGFTESGRGLASLTSNGIDNDVGLSVLGVRAATTLPLYGVMVTPHGSIAWQYAFGDITPEQVLAFASNGIAFGIGGVPIAESSALVEAGLDFAVGTNAALSVTYTGQFASDMQDNSVQGRLNWRF